jgi:putative FmdB family regulatory protein
MGRAAVSRAESKCRSHRICNDAARDAGQGGTMPVYEYLCAECGPFIAIRPMAEFREPETCEECGKAAPRALLTAPAMSGMDSGRRRAKAVNERSANAPTRAKRHPASCGCCSGAGLRKPGAQTAKSFPGKRPWMIGH